MYTHHSGDSYLIAYPNPFKIENWFLIITGLVFAAGGGIVLSSCVGFFRTHQDKPAYYSLALAIGLFVLCGRYVITGLAQLRFLLGRDDPLDLADKQSDENGNIGKGALDVANIMRQRALNFHEPRGPLNGLLYSLVRPLIASPPPIQAAAMRHFHGLLAALILLFSLFFSLAVFSGKPHGGLVSWLYIPLSGLSIWAPFVQDHHANKVDESGGMFWILIGLIAFSMLAPVLLPRFVPPVAIPEMWLAPMALLLGAIITSLAFLAALMLQMDSAPHTDVACDQGTISMNCHPAQIWTQIGRDFQDAWVRKVPNRSYADVPPTAYGGLRGSFRGTVLEETFPIPAVEAGFDSLKAAMGASHVAMLVCLGFWSLLLSAAAVGVSWYFSPRFASLPHMEISHIVLIIAALSTAGILASRIGHLLWSRLYFKSRLVWITLEGTFQEAELRVGNSFTGNAQSRTNLTRVEDATLRVWAADIQSVAFGKDGKRFIMAMEAAQEYATGMADRLRSFALAQSSIVAPTSERDVAKLQAMSVLNEAYRAAGNLENEAAMRKRIEDARAGLKESVERIAQPSAGMVKFFNAEKKFGFISCDDGVNRYFSANALLPGAIVNAGDRVSFVHRDHAKGPQARKVRLYTASLS